MLQTPNQEMKRILDIISKYKEALTNSKDFTEKRAILNSINMYYHKLYEVKAKREGLTSEEQYHLSTLVRNETSKNEKRSKALKNIFEFYCKKAISMVKKYYTFDSINKQAQGMTLENFSVLLKDFRIKLDPSVKNKDSNFSISLRNSQKCSKKPESGHSC